MHTNTYILTHAYSIYNYAYILMYLMWCTQSLAASKARQQLVKHVSS